MQFPTSALILGYDDIETEKRHISNDGESCTKIDPPVHTIKWDTSASKAKSCYCYE
ncbi:hypothetical protein AWENTII_009368 [Aspergillus wentii]